MAWSISRASGSARGAALHRRAHTRRPWPRRGSAAWNSDTELAETVTPGVAALEWFRFGPWLPTACRATRPAPVPETGMAKHA